MKKYNDLPNREFDLPGLYYELIKILCIKDYKNADRYFVTGEYAGPGSNFKKGEYYDGSYTINKNNGCDSITVSGDGIAPGSFNYDGFKDYFYFDKNEIKCNERIELIDKMLNEIPHTNI